MKCYVRNTSQWIDIYDKHEFLNELSLNWTEIDLVLEKPTIVQEGVRSASFSKGTQSYGSYKTSVSLITLGTNYIPDSLRKDLIYFDDEQGEYIIVKNINLKSIVKKISDEFTTTIIYSETESRNSRVSAALLTNNSPVVTSN
jgi:hypothetical protein